MFGATACTASTSAPDDEDFREVTEQMPSGVEIGVEISKPLDGAVITPGPLSVHGFAKIGEAAPIAQTNLSLLLDVSGSTAGNAGCGGDLNGDGEVDTILDCEIAAAIAVNELAASYGTVAKVGVSVFGTYGAAADMHPFATDADLLTEPSADYDGNNVADVEEVLRSIGYGQINLYKYKAASLKTSYGAGLLSLLPTFAAAEQPNNLAIMVSDGKNNAVPALSDVLGQVPDGAVFHTFAIGSKASCDAGGTLGSLRDIADATGGSCTEIPTIAELPDVLPKVISVALTGLELRVDGELAAIDSIMQPLPLDGPAHVEWSTTLHDLAPGEHELCASVLGTDALGGGTATECVTVRINADPVAICEDVVIAVEASCEAPASIDGGSWDPDGQDLHCTIDPEGPYPIGTTEVSMTCEDPFGATSSCDATVEVVDNNPPTFAMNPDLKLWPPNHKSHVFSAADCFATITKTCAGPDFDPFTDMSFELVAVTSDEYDNELGDGNTCEDTIMIIDEQTFEVHDERSGTGDGRVYWAYYRVSDGAGFSTIEACQVTAPHAHGKLAVDSGCMLCVDADPDDGDYCAELNDGQGCPSVYEVCK